MRIGLVKIGGFGRLTAWEYEFAPRLNLVFGPNESGKSTLQVAILTALYGFHQSARAKASESELLRQFRPWFLDRPYAVSMEYRLDDGGAFRVERSFESSLSTALWDLGRACEVTSTYSQGRHGHVSFAKAQWGLDKDLFMRTAFVGQGAIRDLGDREETASAILALLESGTGDATVSQARERLDQTVVAEIGRTDRAYQKPLPQARSQLRKVLQEKEAIELAQVSLQSWEDQRQNAQRRIADLDRVLDRLERSSLQEQSRQTQERLARHASLVEDLQHARRKVEELSPYSGFVSGRYEELMQLSERRASLVERVSSLEQKIAAQAAKRDEGVCEREARVAERDALAHTSALTPELRTAVNGVLGDWRLVGAQIPQEEERLARIRGRMRETGSQLRERRPALRLLRRQGRDAFATLRFEWAHASQRAVDAQRSHDLARDALICAGMSTEEGLRLAALRERVPLDVEQGLRSRDRQIAVLSGQVTSPAYEPASPARKRIRAPLYLLVFGLIDALTLFVLFAVSGQVQLGVKVALGMMALWGLVALAVWVLRTRPRSRSGRPPQAQTHGLSSTGYTGELDAASLAAAQTAALEPLGYRSYSDLAQDLQRYASLAATISAYLHRSDDLHRAEEFGTSARVHLDGALSEVGVGSWSEVTLAELGAGMEQAEALLGQLDAMREDKRRSLASLDDLRGGQERLQNSLDDLFAQAGVPVAPLPQRINTFIAMCDQRDRFDVCVARLAMVEERLARMEVPQVDWCENSRRLEEAEAQMRLLLEEAGVSVAGDLDVAQACREYALRAERKSAFDRTEEDVAALQRSIDSLLSGATVAGLARELASQKERLAVLESRLSGTEGFPEDPDQPQSREQLVKERDEQERMIAALGERIRAGTEGHRPMADVEEEIAYFGARISALESFRRSLDRAMQVLQEAAEEYHREFSPRLQNILNETLSFLTDGKYAEAHVGAKDLSLAIAVPETGHMQTPDVLSYGTQDELYVLLRIAIAQLMTSQGETIPIMLDDPFVNFDTHRLARMLELLVQLSKAYQVFLFTKDESIREWFEAADPQESSLVVMS